jgi:vitamin B12 transporter
MDPYYLYGKSFVMILLLHVVAYNLYAQHLREDSVYAITPIQINGYRYQDFNTGIKSQTIDSNYLKNNPGSLADVLSNQSSVYIKSYGMSSLSSISIRGSSASQTLATINGMNINSPTLGQSDYATIPAFLFNNTNIQYGSQVSLMGSGAIGGSIHLSNQVDFAKRNQVSLIYQNGSFGNNLPIVSVKTGDSMHQLTVKAYDKQALNNISYYSGSDKEYLDHANLKQAGIYVDYSIRLKNHTLNYWIWYQQMNRDIPGTISASFSDAVQYDRYCKQGIQWKYAYRRSIIQSRLGIQNDIMKYNSDTTDIHSVIKSMVIQAEGEYRYTLSSFIDLLAGSQVFLQQASSANFSSPNVYQNKMAFFVSSKIRFLKNKIELSPAIRKEWCNHWIPFTPSIGMNAQISPLFRFHGSVSYNYRIPTLNDLYWNPGGNVNLKPESGWGEEVGFSFEKKAKKISLFQDITGYTRTISNWIQWLPNNGLWTPQNIQKVWSRGIESISTISFLIRKQTLTFKNSYAFTRSTNVSVLSSNDPIRGKQLIYVPLYKNSFTVSLSNKLFETGIIYNYTSWSFTLSDNSSYINPYHLFDMYGIIKKTFKKCSVVLNGRVNNIFNANYQVVADRPMPLRNYQITLIINYN